MLNHPAKEDRTFTQPLTAPNALARSKSKTKAETPVKPEPTSLSNALPTVETFYEWPLTTDLHFRAADRIEFQFPTQNNYSAKIKLIRKNQPTGHLLLGLDAHRKVARLDCFQKPVGLKRTFLAALRSAQVFLKNWPITCDELKNIRYQIAPEKEFPNSSVAPREDQDDPPF